MQTADRYLARLRELVERVEASEYGTSPQDALDPDEMAVLAVRLASVATLLDATLTLGYSPIPADWQGND